MTVIDELLSLPGHQLLMEIPLAFLEDDFNLAGLSDRSDLSDVDSSLSTIINSFYALSSDSDSDSDAFKEAADDGLVSDNLKRMYYVLHQRYALSKAGLAEAMKMYEQAAFGRCRRHLCNAAPLLPCGESSKCGKPLRGLCPGCRELYVLGGKRIDGACYGESVAGMLLLLVPGLRQMVDRIDVKYVPRIYGFRLLKYSSIQ